MNGSSKYLYFDFDLTYRIADDKEIAVLWDDVINDFLERHYMNEKYKALFDSYIEKTDESRLRALLIKGLRFLTSVTWPDEYLHNQILDFEEISKKSYEEYLKVAIENLILLKDKINDNLVHIKNIYQLYSDSLTSGVTEKGNKLTDNGKEDLANAIAYLDEVILFLNDYCKLGFIISDDNDCIDLGKNVELAVYDYDGNKLNLKFCEEEITIEENGWANFRVKGKSVSVWVKK